MSLIQKIKCKIGMHDFMIQGVSRERVRTARGPKVKSYILQCEHCKLRKIDDREVR